MNIAAAEYAEQLAQRDHVAHPIQERRGIALLRFDVNRFVSPHRVHDHGAVQARRRRRGEAGVAVAIPLHWRSHAVAVAEIDVVAHADFVAVVENRRARKRKQQAVQQLDAPAIIVHQWRQAPADAEIEAHARVGAVGQIHVIALVVGDHLQRQFVVVSQEQRPLAGIGDAGRLRHDIGDRQAVLLAQRHVDARHQREMERHVAFVAVAEIRAHVGGPLVGFRQEHAVGITLRRFLCGELLMMACVSGRFSQLVPSRSTR